jgi:hypothetical protein
MKFSWIRVPAKDFDIVVYRCFRRRLGSCMSGRATSIADGSMLKSEVSGVSI